MRGAVAVSLALAAASAGAVVCPSGMTALQVGGASVQVPADSLAYFQEYGPSDGTCAAPFVFGPYGALVPGASISAEATCLDGAAYVPATGSVLCYRLVPLHGYASPADEQQRIDDLMQLWGLGLVACSAVWAAKAFILKLVTPT